MNVPSEKNFSTSSRKPRKAALAVLAIVLLLAVPAMAGKKKKGEKKPTDPNELFNPLLSIEYSHWLVGPIAEIASLEEIERYLALVTEEEATAFIEEFWTKRAEGYGIFQKKPLQIFDERGGEADKRFSEGTYPGSRTDRGKIFVLFGEPEEIEFETSIKADTPALEVWKYPKDAEAGLAGEAPDRSYRFIEIDGAKVLYTGQTLKLNPIEREKRRRSGFRNSGR